MEKSPDAFRTISEVAADLDLPQHVLRFWETRFSQIKPMKRTGGRRYYRPEDVELVRAIKSLLYGQGYTIKGVQKLFKENGVRAVVAAAREGASFRPAQPALALEEANARPFEPGVVNVDAAAAMTPDLVASFVGEIAECVRLLRSSRAG
jgi:DNA-binding transcriptional MerR regulator